jgi:cystathionine beta-lyase/cystathionine gamma-synthase
MYLPKVYDPAAGAYRVRYAIANILRDRVANEGAFNTCFQMEDAEEVICAVLRRGLKNPKLRAALERSHLVNLAQWLAARPEFSEAYHSTEPRPRARKPSGNQRRKA